MSHLRRIDLSHHPHTHPYPSVLPVAHPYPSVLPVAHPYPSVLPVAAPVSLTLEGQVQNALNLILPLKSPAQMPALLKLLVGAAPEIQAALRSLRYVHFARFLPTPDFSQLQTITTYDGGLSSYTMDFVAVLGDVFTAVLRYIRDAPPLPVQRHPRQFLEFVRAHNMPVGVWSAYPDLTVLEIQRAAAR